MEDLLTAVVVIVIATAFGLWYSRLLHRTMNNPKAFPSDPNEIIKRMSRVCDERNIVERLYPKIAERAGEVFAPEGIVMVLSLAVNDFSRQYPPPLGAVAQRFVPLWIDALIDDKKTAQECKEFLEQVEDEAKKEIPARVEPEGPIEDDALYAAVRKVSDIFFEEVQKADKEGKIHTTPTDDGANPYYNQTDSGLFLEYYYGHPSKVWTPWGYWHFVGSMSYSGDAPWEEILSNVLRRLGATEYSPEQNLEYGTVGPVYAIHQVDGVDLPEPKLRERQNFLKYEDVKNAWENMTQRFREVTIPQ